MPLTPVGPAPRSPSIGPTRAPRASDRPDRPDRFDGPDRPLSPPVTLNVLTSEKRTKLLSHMRMMGLRDSAYWTTWFIPLTLLAFVTAVVTIALAQAVQPPIRMFAEADFMAHVWALFFFSVSMNALMCFFASFLTVSGLPGQTDGSRSSL